MGSWLFHFLYYLDCSILLLCMPLCLPLLRYHGYLNSFGASLSTFCGVSPSGSRSCDSSPFSTRCVFSTFFIWIVSSFYIKDIQHLSCNKLSPHFRRFILLELPNPVSPQSSTYHCYKQVKEGMQFGINIWGNQTLIS